MLEVGTLQAYDVVVFQKTCADAIDFLFLEFFDKNEMLLQHFAQKQEQSMHAGFFQHGSFQKI